MTACTDRWTMQFAAHVHRLCGLPPADLPRYHALAALALGLSPRQAAEEAVRTDALASDLAGVIAHAEVRV